ncbi:Glutamate or tyrosine decarboxylase [Aquiflexum balticum DSM 16537]|uniref:Glutamate or tyrosine decarboxylase n=1 Tax=Aquiflexum balticum DSM 16537 TaxID=758820 RepID=A0A1W2GZW4_9BACT|nr:pyridoxal-dependent decarboxylase [Aquiflexum balticum]SMD41766.1 Glutamate or tyrosine decarboxylase [Aquiflexum balticum DSM 16537]
MQSFDLNPSERQELYKFTIDLLEKYYSDTKSNRVSPKLDISKIVDAVRKVNFSEHLTSKEAIKHLVEGMKNHSVHTPHPKYFGLYNPRANFPSIMGDLITAVFNPQLAAWSHSPFANEIENYLIAEFGKKFGYPHANIDGVFASGGAEANLTSVLCAVNHAFPQFAKSGWFGMSKRPVMYCSAESHHSVHKAAKTVGLGYDAIRNIPVRKDLKMDLEQLKGTIQKDVQEGYQPFMVIGTAGTTGTGAIDDLVGIRKIADEYALWFHVDAAYGGAAVLHPDLKDLLDGISLSDSITFDAHKWLSVTMGTSLFITRHKGILSETFRITAEYMPKEAKDLEIVDPFTHSIQWSRRAYGIKLYLALMIFGWEGYEKTIRHQTKIGEKLKELLEKGGWTVMNSSPFPVVCFMDENYLDHPDFTKTVINEIIDSGKSWISIYPIFGKPTFRACITNYNTSVEDIEELVGELNEGRERFG